MRFFSLIVIILLIISTLINARYHRLRHIRLENSYCNGYQELRNGNCTARLTSCSNLTPLEIRTMRQIMCGFKFNEELQSEPENIRNDNETEPQQYYLDVPEADIHSFPWMAAIYSEDRRFLCSGALVSPQVIVTSAQCVSQSSGTNGGETQTTEENPTSQRYIVRLGEQHLNISAHYGNVYEYDVESIDISQEFDSNTYENDIAIIRLVSRVPICLFPPIRIPRRHEWWLDADHIKGLSAKYVGWGLPYQRSYLRAMSGKVLSPNFCSILFNWDRHQLNRTHLCVDSPSGICVSDTGGPLITYVNHHWVLIGIMTFGKHCRTPGLPLIFTRVTEFIGDISRYIEEDFKSQNTSLTDECHKTQKYYYFY